MKVKVKKKSKSKASRKVVLKGSSKSGPKRKVSLVRPKRKVSVKRSRKKSLQKGRDLSAYYVQIPEGRGYWIPGDDYTKGFRRAVTKMTKTYPNQFTEVWVHPWLYIPGDSYLGLEIKLSAFMNFRQLQFAKEAEHEESSSDKGQTVRHGRRRDRNRRRKEYRLR